MSKREYLSQKKIRKYILVVALLIIFALAFSGNTVFAAEKTNEEVEKELEGYINTQLNDIDFSGLEELIKKLNDSQHDVFGGTGFKEKVLSVLNGDFGMGYDSFLSACLNLVFSEIIGIIPLFSAIIAIAVLSSLLGSIKSSGKGSSTVVYFACFGGVILITSQIVLTSVEMARSSVGSMQTQMDIVFPILLTIMTALGSVSATAVYQPLVIVLSTGVANIMTKLILPIFIISYVFNIVGNLNPNIKLSKFCGWLSSLTKWILGIVFTVFTAFMSIQGITAAVRDSVSLKTAKYAISHYIPIVGGFLSDGLNLIMAGGVLIKNAIGVGGIILLLATVLLPVIKILALKLGLQLVGAILEPLSNSGYSGFVTNVSSSLNIVIAVILIVGFMYFISLMLIICTANNFIMA